LQIPPESPCVFSPCIFYFNVSTYDVAYAQFHKDLWALWRWCSCSAETCRSKIDILNIWFTLKMHFVGLSLIIIWKCMIQAAKKYYCRNFNFVRQSMENRYNSRHKSSKLIIMTLKLNL
jgi:hypothetical protein